MMLLMSIRVAEPWTPFSLVAMVVLTIVLVIAVVVAVRRS
jgi:hypothetical protein